MKNIKTHLLSNTENFCKTNFLAHLFFTHLKGSFWKRLSDTKDNINTMIKLIRTSSDDQNFTNLVKLLDADLAETDGTEHSFYAQFNKIDKIKHAVVVYDNEKPIGCGAMKDFTQNAMEVKRMYTLPESRGKGIATLILGGLEKWAAELLYQKCVLETGKRQPDAIALYLKNGYKIIPNYGQYIGVENSVCFEKELKS